jgi:predicted site-specific integrase-resolvase
MGILQTACHILMALLRYETMRGILKGGASMLVGYARVSTTEQHLDLQRDALTQAGCGHIFTDTASGAKAERPSLTAALNYAREGDVLAVWKLDRLGRSLKDHLEIETALEQRGIGFKSLQEGMDTTTPGESRSFTGSPRPPSLNAASSASALSLD